MDGRRRLLDRTLEQIAPIAEETGNRFYARLFETAPEVLPLFRRNLSLPELAPAAAHRFVQLLTITIAFAADEQAADDHGARSVRRLAERHAGYHVDPAHYAPMGDALIWTLERQLGERFDRQAALAWREAYDRLSERMIDVLHDMAGV
jgi:hemoglobin-like flavoprotein